MQLGTPADICARPANTFVARFMGTTNFIHGKVKEIDGDRITVMTDDGLILCGRGSKLTAGQDVDVAVRPENIDFATETGRTPREEEVNYYDARVARATCVGEVIDYQINLGDSLIRAKGSIRTQKTADETVRIHLDPDQLVVLGE